MARLNRTKYTREKSRRKHNETEPKLVAFKVSAPVPHQQLSLLAITVVLNTLLWTSILCCGIGIYQIASDSDDASNILPGVLILISAIVTIAYTIVHTTYSVKQRALTYQQLDPSTIKKTTYIVNRLVVSLCVLWLLTAGWNMILVARRPTCLSHPNDGQSWESGLTCIVSRVGMALAMIALIGSLTLFGMLAAVRRPFEAHLFKYGQWQATDPDSTPHISRRPSEDHTVTEKLVLDSRMPASTHTRSTSNFTNADVETLDLNASRPGSVLHPSPSRDRAGMGIFTSPFAPPPLPPAFMVSVQSPSLQSPTPAANPFTHTRRMSLTPRADALLAPAAYIPHSIPLEFSASAQRAVYPDASSPYRCLTSSRSQPHLRNMSSFSARHRYSRSSVSLSRPHRVSPLSPMPNLEYGSRSENLRSSEGLSNAGDSPSSKSGTTSSSKRASAAEIVHAIANNTPIPGTDERRGPRKHWRTASVPNANFGARTVRSEERMALGWKPDLKKSQTVILSTTHSGRFDKLVRSASAELLGRFGPGADDMDVKWKKDFEREIEDRLNDLHSLPFEMEGRSVGSTETLRESCGTGSLEEDQRFEDAKEVAFVSSRPVSQEVAFV